MPDDVLASIEHALHDWDTSPDAMRWTPQPVEPALTPDQIEALRRSFNTLGAMVASGMKALAKALEQAGKAYRKFAHRLVDHDRVRCRICRPYANPEPLAFGAEYRRRQSARRRRNR